MPIRHTESGVTHTLCNFIDWRSYVSTIYVVEKLLFLQTGKNLLSSPQHLSPVIVISDKDYEQVYKGNSQA